MFFKCLINRSPPLINRSPPTFRQPPGPANTHKTRPRSFQIRPPAPHGGGGRRPPPPCGVGRRVLQCSRFSFARVCGSGRLSEGGRQRLIKGGLQLLRHLEYLNIPAGLARGPAGVRRERWPGQAPGPTVRALAMPPEGWAVRMQFSVHPVTGNGGVTFIKHTASSRQGT